MKYLFNSHPLQDESITIGLTKNMTVSFQLALTTKWIPSWIFHLAASAGKVKFTLYHNTRRCHFNSHSLRSVSGKSSAFPIVLILSTRARYGAYLGKQHEYIREVHLSTRTLYGVYLRSFFFTCGIFSFQLAPSTECILFFWPLCHILKISTRTLYGVYQYNIDVKPGGLLFQLAPSTECISKMA